MSDLDQVLGRLEPAGDELEQHVEEDVVGELLLADLVLLLRGSGVIASVCGSARRSCDHRLDDLPHLARAPGRSSRESPRASSRRGFRA